jgi:ABC-type branched-subunit amino acid transport system permease subunit
MQDFVSISLVYLGIYALAAWSLNLQFGYAGIINFGWIVFQSIGAYFAAVTSLGPVTSHSYQSYIFGASLSFPLPLIIGTLSGAVLAAILGFVVLTRKIRSDFVAVIMLVVAIISLQVVIANVSLFNGANGLSGIPQPFNGVLHLSRSGYQWFYVGWLAVICVIVYLGIEWLCRSSWGRSLRAMREDEVLATHLGINVQFLRLVVFVIGGAIAAFSGALLVEFLGAWSPDAWSFVETFVVFVAVYIGGRGNNRGAFLGALLVPVIFGVFPSFLPAFGYPGLSSTLQWIVIALLWLCTFYFRPAGILPEGRLIVQREGQPDVSSMFQRGRRAREKAMQSEAR